MHINTSIKISIFFTFLLISFLSTMAQPYPIGVRSATFVDASRSNRNIAVEVRYPAVSTGSNTAFAAGQFPVVVFGHGFSMGIAAYTNIWQFLVPQGYIVVMVNTETGLSPSHDNFGKDLAFCANKMQQENTTSGSPYFGKVLNRTAIMGHSMGGGCTLLAAAGNANITTIVGLAAAETNPSAAAAAATVMVPSLILAGENDCVTPQADHQIPIYNALTTCKYYVEINDGIHCDFTNGVGNAPWDPAFNCYFGGSTCGNGNGFSTNQSTQQARMEAVVLPWLNFWLKDNCGAWTTFTDALPNTNSYSSYQSSCTNPLPTAAITPTGTTICQGQNVVLSASGGISYVWSPAGSLSSSSTSAPTASPTTTTTYTVTVTDARGCTDTEQTMVNVSVPTVSAGIDQTICSGGAAMLSAMPAAFVSYSWSTGGTNQTISVTPTNTTAYTVTVTDAAGCSATDNVTVNTTSAPTVSAGIDQTICSGGAAMLSAMPAAFVSYSWSTGGTNQTISVTPTNTTAYTVTVTDAAGCSATDNVTVNTTSAPTVSAGIDQTICSGGAAMLSAMPAAFVSYSWSTGGTNQTISVTPTNTTAYTVTVTDAAGCSATDNVTVSITPCTYSLQGRVWLQGPYLSATGRMDTTLRNKEILPLIQPYTITPWNYNGTESVGSITTVPLNVCDWILVEARRGSDTTLVERHAAWVLSDGQLVGVGGSNNINFTNLNDNNNYFIALRHRNHLDILSQNAYTFTAGTPVIIDFTNPANVENGSTQLINTNGVWAMVAGDNDGNGRITVADFDVYTNNTNTTSISYYPNRSDVDLNRVVSYRDYNFYRANLGRAALLLLRY